MSLFSVVIPVLFIIRVPDSYMSSIRGFLIGFSVVLRCSTNLACTQLLSRRQSDPQCFEVFPASSVFITISSFIILRLLIPKETGTSFARSNYNKVEATSRELL